MPDNQNFAKDLQDLKIVDGKPLYWHIANKAVHLWNKNGNVLLIIGATYPEELAEIRAIAGEMTFLVPGIGAQGGSLQEVAKYGLTKDCGLLVNSSRNIIYASKGTDFAEKAREEALKVQREMAAILDANL